MADAGFRLTVEGEKEFKAALASIDQQIKINKAQIKLLTQEYNLNENGMQTLTTKQSVLQSTYDEQAKKVAALDDKYKAMADTYGQTDKRVATLKVQMLDAATAMAKTEEEIKKNADAMDAYQAAIDEQNSAQAKAAGSLKEIDARLKANEAEMKKYAARYEDSGKSVEGLRKQNDLLGNSVEEQKKRVELLNAAMQEAVDKYGEQSQEVAEYREQLANAETSLQGMEKQIRANNDAIEDGADAGVPLADVFDKISSKLGVEIPGGLESLTSGFGVAAAAAGAVVKAVQNIYADLQESAKKADEIFKNAANSGVSAEEWQELEYIAAAVGTETDVLADSLKELKNKMYEAQQGNTEYALSFANLGVKIEDGNGELRDAYDVFGELIERYGSIYNETERSALMMQMFGDSANQMAPYVEAGADTLDYYRKMAHETGYVIENDTLVALDKLQRKNDLMAKQAEAEKATWSSFWQTVAGLFVGNSNLGDVGNAFGDWWKTQKGLWKSWLTPSSQYADGTYNHPGGLALVGERGPELLRLPTGSQVYPTGVSQSMMQSARGGGDTYNITIDAKSVREFNDIVRLAKSARQNRRMGVAE